MTNAQRLALFEPLFRYIYDLRQLKDGQLDARSYFEPIIDKMLAEAREEGRQEAKGVIK